MESHIPLAYPSHPSSPDPPYESIAISSGLPSFDHSTAILPQYSHDGRMEPEFIYDPSEEYTDDDDRIVIALGHTTKILGYEPREGTHLTRIVVRLLFRRDFLKSKTRVRLRVKMGNIPISTWIEGVLPVKGVGGEWRLHLVAPDPRELDVVGLEVPLIVQALDVQSSTVIDDVCIGPFKFWNLTPAEESHAGGSGYFEPESQELNVNEYSTLHPLFSRSISFEEGSSSSQTDEESFSTSYPGEASTSVLGLTHITEAAPGGSTHKRARLVIEVPPHDAVEVSKSQSNIQSPSTAKSFPGQSSGEDTYQVSLRFGGDLVSMTSSWTPEEVEDERRIVEFFCVRSRGCIDVTFAPITVENARDKRKNIVSCIWWKDAEEFIITSVDTINLLERLVGTKFTTEEKNRIRRNLQGFKPATISKSSPESGPFFRTLMEFPPPRPRNIEKDVKAFKWSKLPFMLEKVISKYWFVSSPSESEADESSPRIRILREIDGASTDSPGMSFHSPSTSQTPTSAPPSQTEVETTRAGVLEASPYIPTSSAGQGYYEEYRSGLSTHEQHLNYPQPSQSSTDSVYGRSDALMGAGELYMGEMQPVSMGDNRVPSQYQRMETYHEASEMHGLEGTYAHQGGTNEMTGEDMQDLQYMAHTSRGYA